MAKTAKRNPLDDDPEVQAFDAGELDLTGLRRAKVTVGREPKSSLAVRFELADLERLRVRAEGRGVGITQLVRQWVLERLSVEDAGGSDALVQDVESAVTAASEALEQMQRVAAEVRASRPADEGNDVPEREPPRTAKWDRGDRSNGSCPTAHRSQP